MRGSIARKMPMTIIRITLVTAPSALPTALVKRPTDPSNCVPSSVGGVLGMSPREAANSINRENCAVTTIRNASNCAAMVVPA
jgi:hypothetical protein